VVKLLCVNGIEESLNSDWLLKSVKAVLELFIDNRDFFEISGKLN
jgi:hypothetical protein